MNPSTCLCLPSFDEESIRLSLHFSSFSTSMTSISYLDRLPTEILFHIFHHLDAVTLQWSLRQTCHRLRIIIDSYDRFGMDVTSLSESEFPFIFRTVNCDRITSLTFSHSSLSSEIIETVCLHFPERAFRRLKSLVATNLQESDCRQVMERIDPVCLVLMKVYTDEEKDHRWDFPLFKPVSPIVAHSSLRRLELGRAGYGALTPIVEWSMCTMLVHLQLDVLVDPKIYLKSLEVHPNYSRLS